MPNPTDFTPTNWHFTNPVDDTKITLRLMPIKTDGPVQLSPWNAYTQLLQRDGGRRKVRRGHFWEEPAMLAWVKAEIQRLQNEGWKLAGMTRRAREIYNQDFKDRSADVSGYSAAPCEAVASPAIALPSTPSVRLHLRIVRHLAEMLAELPADARLMINGQAVTAIDIETDPDGNMVGSHYVNLRSVHPMSAIDHTRCSKTHQVTTVGGLQNLLRGANKFPVARILANGLGLDVAVVEVDQNERFCASRYLNFVPQAFEAIETLAA